jgi:hypothetical protein
MSAPTPPCKERAIWEMPDYSKGWEHVPRALKETGDIKCY